MQETAHTFCPSRCAASILFLLWCAGSLGVLLTYGVGLRGGCGMLFTAVLLWLSYLDLRDGMLYDCITLPFAVLGLMISGLDSISDALLGGTLCGVLFYCLYIAARGGLGGGDVKLAAGLGLWLGWEAAIVAVWMAFLLGGVAAAFLFLTGRKSRQDGIPFGPFLAVGGYVGCLAGRHLWQLYWGVL